MENQRLIDPPLPMNLPFVMLLYQNYQLSAYVAIQVVIPEYTPLLLVVRILFRRGQMAEHQPEQTEQPLKFSIVLLKLTVLKKQRVKC